jgi:hypothetical protein
VIAGNPDAADRQRRLAGVIAAVRAYWGGRRVVLTAHAFNGGMRALAEELTNAGAELAAIVTHVPLGPADPTAPHVWCCAERGLRLSSAQFEAWLLSQPPKLADWLDARDPERSWQVLGTTYSEFTHLGRRSAYGRWRPEWAVWEDKTRIDDLWRRAGVPSPAHAVLALDERSVARAAARLDHGYGVMMAIDGSRDILGSSQGLRWIRCPSELTTAVREVQGRTARVRLAAFVRGTPCSILGMVMSGHVAVFDPIEVITLHRPSTGQLEYCGTSTAWRPSAAEREELREYTRLAGLELARSHGFIGMFSVDGILGDGFLATELNPRHVSGLGLRAGWPEFPTRLLNRAVQEGKPEARGVRWDDVEHVYRDVVRRVPSYSLWLPVAASPGSQGGEAFEVTVNAGHSAPPVRVRCHPEGGGIRVSQTTAGPDVHHGALGPVAAAVARSLGDDDLRSFTDPSLSSELTVR